jgi:hypothetical protein
VRDDGLPRENAVAGLDGSNIPTRQVKVNPRAEAYHAETLPPGQIVDGWYHLRKVTWPTGTDRTSSNGRKRRYRYHNYPQPPGRIHLGLQIALKGGIPWQIAPFQLYAVTLTVFEAKDVPKMDVIGTCDPYCLVALIGSRLVYKTKVIKKTYTPTWNETVSFLLTNPTTDVLRIFMKDDDIAFDDPIATLDLPIAPLLNRAPVEAWVEMKPTKRVKMTPSIRYKIAAGQARPREYRSDQTGYTEKSTPAQICAAAS